MQNFILTLFICSLTMSTLALLYMSAMPLLAKHYSEKWRYYAWLIIIIGLIIPFRPQWNNTLFTVEVPSSTSSIVHVNSDTPTHFPPTMSLFTMVSVWQIIGAVWLAGVIIFIAYNSIKHYRFIKMTKRWSKGVKDGYVIFLLERLSSYMGIAQRIPIYICPCVGSPMMVGLIKPRILLPTLELPQDELCFILKHELVHYKRKDLLYKYFVLAATALHWFNPIVYLVAKAVNIQCETSCDAEILQNADIDTRQFYGETIIGVVKYQVKRKTALSTNFYGGKKGMKNRISSIMDTRTKKAGTFIACLLLLFALSTGVIFAASSANGRYRDYGTYSDYPTSYPPIESEQSADEYDESISLPTYDYEAYYYLPENTVPYMSDEYEVYMDGTDDYNSYDHIGNAEITHSAYENYDYALSYNNQYSESNYNHWHNIAVTPPPTGYNPPGYEQLPIIHPPSDYNPPGYEQLPIIHPPSDYNPPGYEQLPIIHPPADYNPPGYEPLPIIHPPAD